MCDCFPGSRSSPNKRPPLEAGPASSRPARAATSASQPVFFDRPAVADGPPVVLGLAPRIRYFALVILLWGGPRVCTQCRSRSRTRYSALIVVVHDTSISTIHVVLQRMFLLGLYVRWSVAVGRVNILNYPLTEGTFYPRQRVTCWGNPVGGCKLKG